MVVVKYSSTFPTDGNTNQGQVSQVFSSMPRTIDFDAPSATVSGTITLFPTGNTTYYANFQSHFTGGFNSSLSQSTSNKDFLTLCYGGVCICDTRALMKIQQ